MGYPSGCDLHVAVYNASSSAQIVFIFQFRPHICQCTSSTSYPTGKFRQKKKSSGHRALWAQKTKHQGASVQGNEATPWPIAFRGNILSKKSRTAMWQSGTLRFADLVCHWYAVLSKHLHTLLYTSHKASHKGQAVSIFPWIQHTADSVSGKSSHLMRLQLSQILISRRFTCPGRWTVALSINTVLATEISSVVRIFEEKYLSKSILKCFRISNVFVCVFLLSTVLKMPPTSSQRSNSVYFL